MYDVLKDDLILGGAVIAAARGPVPAVDFKQQASESPRSSSLRRCQLTTGQSPAEHAQHTASEGVRIHQVYTLRHSSAGTDSCPATQVQPKQFTFHQAPPAISHTARYHTDMMKPSWYHLDCGT